MKPFPLRARLLTFLFLVSQILAGTPAAPVSISATIAVDRTSIDTPLEVAIPSAAQAADATVCPTIADTTRRIYLPLLRAASSQPRMAQEESPSRDPHASARRLTPTAISPFAAATRFLYTEPNAIQTSVAPNAITDGCAAVLRGRVMTRDGKPLAGVQISVLDKSEYGSTASRADGMFDLAVNGGTQLTVRYDQAGFIPVQRQIHVPTQDYSWLPDVALIPYDTSVTPITQGAATFQVARGSAIVDGDGARRATLLFPPTTHASITLQSGERIAMAAQTSLQVRATEYTVGANGPAAMPGTLPPSSGYTYAVELSVDQAIAAGAADVQFNQPVFFYVENFLHFPVGGVVPMGYYDRTKGAWVPSANGRVIGILAIVGGLATLDTNGDGAPDDAAMLAALGVTDVERQQLAGLYQPGQSLWRVPITHFTPWDLNWPFGPPSDARAPQLPDALNDDKPDTTDCAVCEGSTVEVQSQVLGEDVDVAGTPFSLHYRSDRVPGRSASKTIPIPLSGANIPASLKRIDLDTQVAGRQFTQSFPPAPNQSYTFTWDGQDAYGRAVQGRQPVTIRIGYVYDATYQNPAQLTQSFAALSGVPITGDRARQEVTIWQEQRTTIGAWDARGQGLGGWSLSVHHAYDPVGRVLYMGDGSRRSAAGTPVQTIETVAGTGQVGNSGDGGPATQASIYPAGVAIGPDGSLFITSNSRVRRVAPNGSISTVAGGGSPSSNNGDGGPATAAVISSAYGIVIGPDGSLYISERFAHRVRRVGPDGIISTIAGTGIRGYNGDGIPATQAQLDLPQGIAMGPDGSLYIADTNNNRLRRIGLDGIITTVAGDGTQLDNSNPSCKILNQRCGDGGPATQAQISGPVGLAIATDGTLYTTDYQVGRLRAIRADGTITSTADVGRWQGQGVAIGPNGRVYISYYYGLGGRVFQVNADGTLTAVAGDSVFGSGFSGDGGPATQAHLSSAEGIAVGQDGSIYVVDYNNYRVRRIGPSLPGFTAGEILIPSEDSAQLYVFDSVGRHLRTLNALTGSVLYQFSYDANGLLAQIADGDGNITRIERGTSGAPTGIVGPYDQRTAVSLDVNGYLAHMADPLGEITQFGYTAAGLLTSMTDPQGNIFHFAYDALGRLATDSDPAGGSQSLARTDSAGSYAVTRATSLNRNSQYQVARTADGGRRDTTTNADGTQSIQDVGTNGSRSSALPDGTKVTQVEGPDPRFGMLAPVLATQLISTSQGLLSRVATSRSARLFDPADRLSLRTLTETVTLNNRSYTSIFDAASRTFTDTSPQGRQQTYTIDAQGRVTAAQVAGLAPSGATYDTHGRLATSTIGSGPETRTTSYTYNTSGYLDTITDPLGRTVRFAYDAAGRLTQQTLTDGRVIGYAYDANGNLTSLTPPGRPAHGFSYTPVNLLAAGTPPSVGAGSTATQYAYNADRQLTQITRPDGKTVALGYDSAGRPQTVTIARGQFGYTYSPTTGNLTTISAPGGLALAYAYDRSLPTGVTWSGTVAGSVSYAYDNDFRLASTSVNGGNTIAYQYDSDSLLTQAGAETFTHNAQNDLLTGSTLGGISDSWGYNGFGEPASYSATAGATSLYSVQYTRDKLGRIAAKAETIGGVATSYGYSYDQRGRLTGVTRNGATIESYSYDANGNRLSGPGVGNATYDDQDRLLQYGSTAFTYTANGELQSKISGGQTTTYQYDELGNLTAATLPGGTQIAYLIDGQSRRIGKRVNGALTQGWLYDGQLRPIAELNGSGTLVSRFVYAGRANVPDYMIKNGVTYRIIADQLGSPRLVVDSATGQIVQRMDYDAFGNVTQDTSPGFQPFGFAGGLYDRDTKLTRFGARDYDAETGRWTAKDPIGFAGGDANVYAYVAGDPVNRIDPTGAVAGVDDLAALGVLVIPGVGEAILITATVGITVIGIAALADYIESKVTSASQTNTDSSSCPQKDPRKKNDKKKKEQPEEDTPSERPDQHRSEELWKQLEALNNYNRFGHNLIP